MKNNFESIPNEVFSWVQSTSFNQLNSTQQQTVLAYLDEQEYEDMHHAAKTLITAATKATPRGKEKVKEELLTAFNQHHNKGTNAVLALINKPVSLGKVAAVVVLMLSAIVWQYISNTESDTIYAEHTKTDTLLVETEVPVTYIIHDTLRVMEKQAKSASVIKTTGSPVKTYYKPTVTDLHIAGTDELDKPYNQPKHNSLKNDTLATKFGFVSL